MAGRSFHLVPDNDKPYFLQATVHGLRIQLNENDLDDSGLKYDLYLRLTTNGHRLYTDDRSSSEDDQSGDEDPGDDHSGDENPGDDHLGDKDPEDNHSGDDQDGNPPGDDQGGDLPGGGGKRRRDDDDDGHDDNDPPPAPAPPQQKRIRVGPRQVPVEVQLQIVESLNADQTWNLAMACPLGYLSNQMNLFILEARRQHDIDDNDPNRRPSILEWAGGRCMYDSAFRTARRAFIMQVVDAYLQVYGNADPAPGSDTEIERMLWYFRHSPPQNNVLLRAARRPRPDIVHLLLLRGANVDQTMGIPPITPLSGAAEELEIQTPDISSDGDLLQCIFALIGAGADVRAVRGAGGFRARAYLGEFIDLPDPDEMADFPWPRIMNFRQVSAREFVADERSDHVERIIVAMYAIWRGTMTYPGFEF